MKIKENFSMNTVKVRNLELGNGIPAICIPNVGKTKEDILSLMQYIKEKYYQVSFSYKFRICHIEIGRTHV